MDKEFEIIKKYFAPLANNQESLNLQNDAAFFKDKKLVISTDMMVEGKHFNKDDRPEEISRKLLRINLSDIAAMGATPYGFFLNIALPKSKSSKWLKRFISGLNADMLRYKIKLFGGDLSESTKVFLSVTILGKTESACHTKNFAKNGSKIFVSGNIGDAPLGFVLTKNNNFLCSQKTKDFLISRFKLPEPKINLGKKILNQADFCTDISDGLLREMLLISNQSNLQANIFLDKIPLSLSAKEILNKNNKQKVWEVILSGGEDYELLFSFTSNDFRSYKKGENITNIGFFSAGKGIRILDSQGNEFKVKNFGFNHF
ncbi:MAG: thiamine-phosphate kinase [Alphaproteobacteria bacterium]